MNCKNLKFEKERSVLVGTSLDFVDKLSYILSFIGLNQFFTLVKHSVIVYNEKLTF